MAVCKFWIQGNCRFGNSCKYEHPLSNQNRFGGFGAPSSNTTSLTTGPMDPENPYSVSTAGIVKDLTEERPPWIFSAYGPGRDAPGQLFGGQQIEQSFEELRLHHWKALAAGNPQAAINDIDSLYQQVQRQMENAVKAPAEAMRFVLDAEKQHPNRLDICKNNSLPSTTGGFAADRSGPGQQAGAFGSTGQSSVANPFSRPAVPPSGFGSTTAPSAFSQGTGPAFGRPAQLGNGAFGQPSQPSTGTAFGQPSQPASAFGQPSQLGGVSSFGKPTQLGGVSAFGQPTSLGQKPAFGAPSFGASPFGQPAASGFSKFAQTPGASGSAFGKPTQPEQGAGGSGFGQASKLGGGPAFGQASGLNNILSPFAAATGNTASPFAAQSNATAAAGSNAPNPFGSAGAAPANPFSQAAASGSPNTFGQAKPAVNPFGGAQSTHPGNTALAGAAPTPFGQPSTVPSSAPNPFQKDAQAQSAFGRPNDAGVFGSTRAADATQTSAAPLQPTGNAATSVANGGPCGPDAERQHPPIQSYASHDTSGNLVKFKGQAVSYLTKDGVSFPAISGAAGKPVKIWFPKGPPPYNKDTELVKEAYSSEAKTQYDAFMRTGKFDGGFMPELPPRREWCLWDF